MVSLAVESVERINHEGRSRRKNQLDGAPVMEELALARAQVLCESIDLMLAKRWRLTSEAL